MVKSLFESSADTLPHLRLDSINGKHLELRRGYKERGLRNVTCFSLDRVDECLEFMNYIHFWEEQKNNCVEMKRRGGDWRERERERGWELFHLNTPALIRQKNPHLLGWIQRRSRSSNRSCTLTYLAKSSSERVISVCLSVVVVVGAKQRHLCVCP